MLVFLQIDLRHPLFDADKTKDTAPERTGAVSQDYRCCGSSRASDATALRRAAAVVRGGGDVLDRADLQAGGLDGADRGLAAGARTLHEDVDLAHAVLLGATRGGLGGHLRGERSRLAGALEADLAGGRPRDHRTGRVGDRDDGVVEGAL